MSLRTAAESGKLILYGFFRSSSTARLRIALNLKQIPYEKISINILTGKHLEPAYAAINPSLTVPTLIIQNKADPNKSTSITQSFAALEYLEEVFPEHPLLPPLKQHENRAFVRTLTNLMVAEAQPTTSLRLMNRVTEIAGNDGAQAWLKDFTVAALKAYEEVAKPVAGNYSVGDQVTIADVCLVPALWNAVERSKLGLDEYPTIKRVFGNLMKLDAVREAGWWNQEDCPADLTKTGKESWSKYY